MNIVLATSATIVLVVGALQALIGDRLISDQQDPLGYLFMMTGILLMVTVIVAIVIASM